MKKLTKYKEGKFLLNHSSMNEAIDKLGIYELVDELNTTKEYYYKYNNGEIEKVTIPYMYKDRAYIDFSKKCILVTYGGYVNEILEFKGYKKVWSLNREDLENGKEEND